MNVLGDAFLDAASSAADLLDNPVVARRWDEPSALAEFSVRGLAGHLAHQVLSVPDVITGAVPDSAPLTLEQHYGQALWLGTDINNETNSGIRQGGEGRAQVGAAALVAQVRAAIDTLRPVLADLDVERPVLLPWAGWPLTAGDFLITRMMEIAVHSDDLAVSVGVGTPELPVRVLDPVYDLLLGLSLRQYGHTAVLRALTRSERAPATISAF
jgi:hypothetical protein